MPTLQLAANYISAAGSVGFHYGHLQIVSEGMEIEVQSPLGE